MSRPYENFENWMKKDNKTKEDFIQKNKDTWSKSIPQKFNVSISQPLILFGYDQEQATLSTKEIVTVSKEFYETIRKKFREYKYQLSKQHKSRIQARISKSTTSKLEQIKKKLEHSSASGTLEHVINSFDEDKLKQQIQINKLQEQIQKLRDYEEYIKSKHKLELETAHALNQKIQDYLFSQWVSTQQKLEVLENQFPNEDDLDQIYASQSDEGKENSRRIIKSNLQSDFNNNLLRITATLELKSETTNPLHTTIAPISENDYPPIYPRPSGFIKQGEISHNDIEEKINNKQEAMPKYLTNQVKLFTNK
ncbi:hypothetical protein ABTI49_18310 [Acinetobacter baumannii]|uniref:hypothetical protein n=1 Tax=Acinetobacter calcoaceticus/baumannii complex TaxID=909768 RepID=UPI0002AED18B|nr:MULTISPECIES: hypothetical protein [Acinetobacter calcoaceticus/baumannii complex]ELW99910.1 hypothetical protein ACIN5047_0563 [Acinetobacter baumannii OIFC047]EXE19935.1 hypothetical protein J558_0884 [Acinetobacter baumannii 1106579]MCG9504732.1 hypothetical protein [Acinetobacter pittii]MDA4866686.1 hypothetical protein [Acinetobacter baumannii]OTU67925.1 hypothetical protein CAT33_08670 [Acinetobacter baumannii]